MHFETAAQQTYSLVIEGMFPFNVAAGQADIEVLTKHDSVVVEVEEQVEPLRYIEKVLPNKYSTIFSERVFVSKDVSAAFCVEIF